MTLIQPSAVPSLGTRRVVFIEGTVANIKAITPAEMNGGVEVSCYLTRQGLAVTQDQTKIQDGRYCSPQTLQLEGTESIDVTLQYTYNLNTPADDVARLTLERGVSGILVELLQIDEDQEEFATGDFYWAVAIRTGKQFPVAVEENAVDRISQPVFIRGRATDIVQIAAAA
ncbi:hypothetical protein AB0P19_02320 [Microbacterium oleivorans]|uniref:phage tail tube protein n=1 Tax=Microbacterium oleivorans TaxID=273677 RepID=UPI00343FF5EB